MVQTMDNQRGSLVEDGELTDDLKMESLGDELSSEPQSAVRTDRPIREGHQLFHENEFSYRPVPVIAVVGLVMALLSSIALFVWLAIPLCLVGLVLSTLALFVIRRNRSIYSGTMVAVSGMLLSAIFMAGGVGYQVYTYQTEVPEGFQRVDFVKEISDKGFVVENGQTTIHPDVLELEGKEIFLKGYIYQTGRLEGLGSFLLVKDNQSCCFGADPAITDRVGVVMQQGKEISYKAGKVAVAGKFRLNKNFTNEDKEPLYIVDGEFFTSRVSDF